MLPMSHAATGIVAQPGEIGTPGAIPPGHVTNLMLPSHLSSQPIPVHAVTLVPMTSGQPQLLYSMSSQSSVPPALMSSAVTTSTSLPVSSHLQGQLNAGQVVPPSVGPNGDMVAQRQSSFPQIASIQGTTAMQTGNISTSQLTHQIPHQVAAPASILPQVSVPSTVKDKLDLLQTRLQSPSNAYTAGTPILRSDNLINTQKRLDISDGILNSASGGLKSEGGLNSDGIQEDSLNSGDTLVVEMKPVGINEDRTVQDVGSSQNVDNEPSMPISYVTDGPEVAQEIISENEFKGPTLTLSEEGVVNRSIGDPSHNALQGGVELHTVAES